MNRLGEFLEVSAMISSTLLLSVCLLKISIERGYKIEYKMQAFLPIFNINVVAKIVGRKFWDVFLPMFGLGILVRVTVLGTAYSFGMASSENEQLVIIFVIMFMNIFPAWYIWSQIAQEGKHKNPNLLGVLSGIPIINAFSMFYITWKGKWND